jgi:alcohol dehydrogenase (cytochrome c)
MAQCEWIRNRRGGGRSACRVAMAAIVLAVWTLPAVGATAGGDWESYNKTSEGQRFSPLTQINTQNAASIAEVCRYRVADSGSFQSGLIMTAGTLFATTATDTLAFNPTSCELKWRHSYLRRAITPLPVNRGVAYLNGRVFRGTDDGRVFALDAETGKQLWMSSVGDPSLGEIITGAPVGWNGLIIVATAVGDLGIRGKVMAFDALSGREVWRFYTIPGSGETGADSWSDNDWAHHGGGASWSTFSIDQSTGEVFIPVGNPAPDFAATDRLGTNLFTDSIVVLDAQTGVLKWWYQLSPHDARDYDLGAAPVLFNPGRASGLIAAGSKDGYLYVIDREPRKLLYRIAVTTVDRNPEAPTAAGVLACPGAVGGVEWNGPAFDPVQQVLYVGAVDSCNIMRSAPGTHWRQGEVNLGGTVGPGPVTPSGWVTAVDAVSGHLRWQYHAAGPVVAGVTPTAGGILMTGDNTGHFLVFNSATGELLKNLDTGGSLSGGVITYESGGRQYVAITSGNSSRSTFGVVGRPTLVILSTPPATESSDTKSGGAPNPARGRGFYVEQCSLCHGADGKNMTGYDLSTIAKRMSQDQLVAWIKHPAPPMPAVFAEPFEPSDEQAIRDVAAYLRAMH